MTFDPRRAVVAIVILVAALFAVAVLWTARSACVSGGPGTRGEVKVRDDGSLLYFNGECWTKTPMPPGDAPF